MNYEEVADLEKPPTPPASDIHIDKYLRAIRVEN